MIKFKDYVEYFIKLRENDNYGVDYIRNTCVVTEKGLRTYLNSDGFDTKCVFACLINPFDYSPEDYKTINSFNTLMIVTSLDSFAETQQMFSHLTLKTKTWREDLRYLTTHILNDETILLIEKNNGV